MKNELDRFISFINNADGEVHFLNPDNSNVCRIVESLKHLQPFERPDMYAKIGNHVMIIEHFEFDSNRNVRRKGSEGKAELAVFERMADNLQATFEVAKVSSELKSNHSSMHYIENALRGFQDHCSNIPAYKQHLRGDNIIDNASTIETGFFIEDTTILGNIYQKHPDSWEPSITPLFLPYCKPFLDAFERAKDVDLIFSGSYAISKYHLWFMDRASIERHRENQIEVEDIEILNFQPQAMAYKVLVDNEKNEHELKK